jgi:hypothetical protein
MHSLKTSITALFVASAAIPTLHAEELAPPRCDYGAPHENAAEELAQFAFLIGDYTIALHAWRGDAWSPPRPGAPARWNGWYGLGGMAIVDEWYNIDPGSDPDAPRGVNVRMFDSEDDEWDMMWIATAGRQVQDLRAKMQDGVLTMWQVYPERPDFKAEFITEDADHWARIGYAKDDAGEWVKQVKLAATRIACD